MFKTDGGGYALRLNDAKISVGLTSWNTKLSQIAKTPVERRIIIVTYSLPRYQTFIPKILEKRSANVLIICHMKFMERALELQKRFPLLRFRFLDNVHAKVVLIEPDTVWLSSANFGSSKWIECTIGIHSEKAYDVTLKEIIKSCSI